MSTIDWPEALIPQAASLQLRKSGRQFGGPFNGTLQAVDDLAERWVLSATLPPRRRRDGTAGLESFCATLAGGVNRVRAWHFGTRGVPAGSLRGTPTLASAAARGNTSLALAGCTNANLLIGGGFEMGPSGSLVAFGWLAYGNGSYTAAADGLVPGNGSPLAQRITASALGSGTGDQFGVRQILPVPVTAGAAYTLSVDVKCNITALQVRLYWDWLDSSDAFVANASLTVAAPTVWTRLDLSATAPPSAVKAMVYVWMQANTGSIPRIEIDNAQFQAGAVATAFAGPATLEADDMIRAWGQLFQVSANCTANDVGDLTVPLVNRVRGTIASAAAVTWYRPTAEFVMPAMQSGTVWQPGRLEGAGLDLVEVW